MRLCREEGLPLELGDYPLSEVHKAEEAFVTGTFGGITPVREIDGRRLSATLPGPRTRQVRQLYEALKNSYAKQARR